MDDEDRTASLMTPAKLAQLKDRPKPASSPAAWLDQLATDAGSGHVRRLVDLRKTLPAQLRERSCQGRPWSPAAGAGRGGGQARFRPGAAQGLAGARHRQGQAGGGRLRRAGPSASRTPARTLRAEVRALQKEQQAQGSAGGAHPDGVRSRTAGDRQDHRPGRPLAAGHAQPAEDARGAGRRRRGAEGGEGRRGPLRIARGPPEGCCAHGQFARRTCCCSMAA